MQFGGHWRDASATQIGSRLLLGRPGGGPCRRQALGWGLRRAPAEGLPEQADIIRRMHADGTKITAIARAVCLSHFTIYSVLGGQSPPCALLALSRRLCPASKSAAEEAYGTYSEKGERGGFGHV
jgi:hypothetical protein